MIVVISAEAERDIEAIGDHIAKDNPRRALSFVQELRERCVGVADQPYAYPLVAIFEKYGVRRRVHGNYLIFYRVGGEEIVILHVLHGAMDYAWLLLNDEAHHGR